MGKIMAGNDDGDVDKEGNNNKQRRRCQWSNEKREKKQMKNTNDIIYLFRQYRENQLEEFALGQIGWEWILQLGNGSWAAVAAVWFHFGPRSDCVLWAQCTQRERKHGKRLWKYISVPSGGIPSHAYFICDFKRKSVLIHFRFALCDNKPSCDAMFRRLTQNWCGSRMTRQHFAFRLTLMLNVKCFVETWDGFLSRFFVCEEFEHSCPRFLCFSTTKNVSTGIRDFFLSSNAHLSCHGMGVVRLATHWNWVRDSGE